MFEDTVLNGETVKYLREKKYLTQEELAEKVGCSPKTIHNIEKGYRSKNGKKIRHGIHPSTCRNLAEALNVEINILQLPPEKSSKIMMKDEDTKKPFSKQIRPDEIPISSEETLFLFRNRLATSELNENNELARIFKNRIKELCIQMEIMYTEKAAETMGGGKFYYSDSSIIDVGILEYEKDEAWKSLLISAGCTARTYGGMYTRTLFIKPCLITLEELEALCRIVNRHIKHGHSVLFVNDELIQRDLRPKRNIGIMSGLAMVAATDPIQWDLDFSTAKNRISSSLDQYFSFSNEALAVFNPKDEDDPKRIRAKLVDIFPLRNSK